MTRAMPWPCCGPKISVRRISRSSVPCRCALYSPSLLFRIDIRPKLAYLWVECQQEEPMARKRPDEDFADEIAAHIDLEAQRLIDEGLPPAEARAAARRAFGSVAAATERYY